MTVKVPEDVIVLPEMSIKSPADKATLVTVPDVVVKPLSLLKFDSLISLAALRDSVVPSC